MEIKTPRTFKTTDKAHADLFNDMVEAFLDNDVGLLEAINQHMKDINPHASEAEKKKWNDSQGYKITADNGSQLINVRADARIFDAIKGKGTCTFYAASGVEDSPAPANISLRGLQTVGEDNIGTGYAVDIAGNAYSFYYNAAHTAINWTKLPSNAERNKWNDGQLSKITSDNGGVILSISDGEDLLEKVVSLGPKHGTFYATGKALNSPTTRSCRGMYHFTSQDSNGKGTFGWVIAIDYNNYMYTNYLDLNLGWQGWKRVLTNEEQIEWKFPTTIINGWTQYGTHKVQFYKNPFGEVELMGSITGGTIGFKVPVFTLPSGYRPIQDMHFIGIASSIGTSSTPQTHRTHIDTKGNVYIQSVSNSTNPNEFITFGFKFMAAKEG
ncbi:pyocin knob domain-containing protein [Bacillus safensis]